MTGNDEAQPKRTRRRRRTFAKRVELRLTDRQLDFITEARAAATEATGRNVSLSDVIRSAVDDGCKSIVDAMRSVPPRGGDRDRVADAIEEFAEEQRQLRRDLRVMGHNVNQIAKHANASGGLEDGVVDTLEEVKARLNEMDGRLVRIARATHEHSTWSGDDDD